MLILHLRDTWYQATFVEVQFVRERVESELPIMRKPTLVAHTPNYKCDNCLIHVRNGDARRTLRVLLKDSCGGGEENLRAHHDQ
jgi:hypothetical protein